MFVISFATEIKKLAKNTLHNECTYHQPGNTAYPYRTPFGVYRWHCLKSRYGTVAAAAAEIDPIYRSIIYE